MRGSFVPPELIQQLRQYDRRIFDLDAEMVRKLSKLDGIMQRCNIRLSNYVSNTDTKSYIFVVAIRQAGKPKRTPVCKLTDNMGGDESQSIA